mmetsp:Transcript_3059/g.4123  ORF Transcript_3059/g.4123 Transcript_3059/m.4123 type:complete len:133 (+) Transcript_3059:124-522(+)
MVLTKLPVQSTPFASMWNQSSSTPAAAARASSSGSAASPAAQGSSAQVNEQQQQQRLQAAGLAIASAASMVPTLLSAPSMKKQFMRSSLEMQHIFSPLRSVGTCTMELCCIVPLQEVKLEKHIHAQIADAIN